MFGDTPWFSLNPLCRGEYKNRQTDSLIYSHILEREEEEEEE
jgi:hypothetical protein